MPQGSTIGRRRLILAAGSAGLAAAGGVAASSQAAAAGSADRDVVVVGANPGIRLFDSDTVTAFASVWRVDWSPYGQGTVLVLWTEGGVRLIGRNVELATRLERDFTRFFPEAEGLPWPEPTVERRPVHVDIDLEHGLRARAADVSIHMAGILRRTTFMTDEFDLGGREHSLSLLFAPCSSGSIRVRGRRLPGDVLLGGTPELPSSTAFVSEAEIWKR